jgi:hypothetical protein
MKRLLLALSLFFAIPVSAAEITSKITDSIQLSVQGAAVQSTKNWSSRMVFLEQISMLLALRTLVVWLVLEPMTYQYSRSSIHIQQRASMLLIVL